LDPEPPVTRRLTVRLEARSDLAEAYDWYESQKPCLGQEFLAAYDARVHLIEQRPQSFPRAFGRVRKALIPRFPYLIIFEIDEDRIDVIAVFHAMRNPRRWRERV
jgi:plasmid stabilization system protein ParE